MKFLLVVVGDTNDGDYITQSTDVTDFSKEKYDMIDKVAAAVRNVDVRHNWPAMECSNEDVYALYEGILTGDEIEEFDELVPFGEYGIHTIDSIELLAVFESKKLL